jgi:hypothetical protein
MENRAKNLDPANNLNLLEAVFAQATHNLERTPLGFLIAHKNLAKDGESPILFYEEHSFLLADTSVWRANNNDFGE